MTKDDDVEITVHFNAIDEKGTALAFCEGPDGSLFFTAYNKETGMNMIVIAPNDLMDMAKKMLKIGRGKVH